MQIRKFYLATVAALALAFSVACSFTTANIHDLKLSKDEDGNTQTTVFAPGDTIYAQVAASNVPGKITLKWRLIAEKVEGQPENSPVALFDKTVEVEGSGFGTYFLSPPTKGWPLGKYRIEVTMHIESGEQKDQESATFTVPGR